MDDLIYLKLPTFISIPCHVFFFEFAHAYVIKLEYITAGVCSFQLKYLFTSCITIWRSGIEDDGQNKACTIIMLSKYQLNITI